MRGAGYAISVKQELVTEECCRCGILFAMPKDFVAKRQEDEQELYCPCGHRQWYGESEARQLKRELAAERTKLAQLHSQKERIANDLLDEVVRRKALEKEKKAVERRIHAGVCPFCKRSFQNVARHMKSKHEGDRT